MENLDKVTVIGIAGGTGSGKTTVVKRLVEALPPHFVAVVPLDSYYNDTSEMTEEERHQINFDHPDAFDWKLLHEQLADLSSLPIATSNATVRRKRCMWIRSLWLSLRAS